MIHKLMKVGAWSLLTKLDNHETANLAKVFNVTPFIFISGENVILQTETIKQTEQILFTKEIAGHGTDFFLNLATFVETSMPIINI